MTPTTTKKTSILIVEDERIVAVDLQETLSAIGYGPIAIASSADEAITVFPKAVPISC
jgi:CheY-like chemotaxis protein